MIRLENVTKSFHTGWNSRKYVLDNVNATFPSGESVGLLGRNGAGKSTLMKIIAGTIDLDGGRVISDGTVSWPVGFSGSFNGELTGAQNVRFIARVYGVDTDSLLDFVAQFAELGEHFHLPVRSYSSGMKARLAFGLSMGVDFDTYLVDESTAVGDAAFRNKSKAYFLDRLSKSSAIVVSHGIKLLRDICTSGAVLENGHLVYYHRIEDAIAHHEYNMGSSPDDEDEV